MTLHFRGAHIRVGVCSMIALGALACGRGGTATETFDAPTRTAPADAIDVAVSLSAADARLSSLLAPSGAWTVEDHALASPAWGRRTAADTKIATHAPATADGTFEIAASRLERLSFRMSLEGARAVTAVERSGRVEFPNAYPSADVVVTEGDGRFEELLVLRDASAPTTRTWRIDVPRGIAHVARDASGALAFSDGRDRVVARIPRPYAIDATGTRRDADLEWDGARMSVHVDARDLVYPVLLDPALEVVVWSQKFAAAPSARSYASMAYDSGRQLSVLFGGTGASGDIAGTWEWNGTSWANRMPSSQPSARSSGGLAYDSARGVTVLFGGTTGGAETWEWNGTMWSQKSPAQSPTARKNFGMAFDSHRGVVVLFGGNDGAVEADTWEWNGTTWTPATPTASPSARQDFQLTFDSARNVTVLVAGQDGTGNYLGDTWEYDGTTWNEPSASSTVLGSPAFYGLAFDSARAKSVLMKGFMTYEWDGATWTQTTPTFGGQSRNGPAMVFDPGHGETALFGGIHSGTPLSDTWVYATQGGACTTGMQCDTGSCVDGVCCESASCGTCQACDLATPGTCTAVTNGTDPDSCTGNDTCDANGNCLLTVAQPCTGATQCASAFCVDSVCCSTACTGLCEACSATTKNSGTGSGTCDVAKDGTDPHSDCPTDPVAGCERDGLCNQGACELYVSGTSCGSSVCTGNSASGQLCNGLGMCEAMNGIACAPGLCTGGSCTSTCTSDADCDPTTGYCNGAECKTKEALGAACTAADECAGGICVDSHCCNEACQGECEACDVMGSEGTCSPVAGAPHGARPACPTGSASEPCAAALCNGDPASRTSCAGYVGSSIPCRSAGCSNGTATVSAACDGHGNCPAAVTMPCTPFACGATTCLTTCATTDDCAASYACVSGQCIAGAMCDSMNEIVMPGAQPRPCAPYACEAGSCKTQCATISDCAPPNVCTAQGACEAPPSSSNTGSSGGCALGFEGAEGTDAGWVSLFAAALVVGRRRRRARRSANDT
jgi:hypothetical protein